MVPTSRDQGRSRRDHQQAWGCWTKWPGSSSTRLAEAGRRTRASWCGGEDPTVRARWALPRHRRAP